MMRRPASVPRAARFSTSDGWWQVGEIRDGMPRGPWRTFRPDGSPLFTARFDDDGRLQGRFRRFHPDGSLAREARYTRGLLQGRVAFYRAKGAPGDVFPTSDARAWQVVARYKQGAEKSRLLLDDRGHELADAPAEPPGATPGALDDVLAAAEPDGFLASPALARVLAALPPAEPPPRDDFLLPAEAPPRRPLDGKRFQDLYGAPAPAPLRAWLEAFATPRALHALRVARDNDVDVAGNLVEALIVEHQHAPGRAVGLRALASGLVPIGDDGTLAYCASVCESPNGITDAVYTFPIAGEVIQIPVARTLDDLAFAVALASADAAGALSQPALQRAYAKLRGRVDLRAPLSAIEQRALPDDDDDAIVGDPAQDHREGFHFRRPNPVPPYFFFRSRWLLRLLCGHADGAAADFDPRYEGGLDDKRFEIIRQHVKEPWVAFYWLFRCLVFADPRLDALLAIASDTPSRLVRDLAALVGELARGRAPLGAIDFQATVAQFRALDPLANKSESDDDAETPAKLDIPEELAPAAAVLEWARAEGYSRENLLIDDELDVAALGLALRADPRIVPHIADLVDANSWLGSRLLAPWLDGDRADLAALAPRARGWLRDGEAGVYTWELAARILARAGTPDDAALVAGVLEPALDAMFQRGQGFEAAMGHHELEKGLAPILEAQVALGIPDALFAALEGVCSADSHLVDDARGPCALALAAVGRGLAVIVAGVRGQLARGHGHRVTAGQLLAIGALGSRETEPRRSELVELVESIDERDDEAGLARAIALHDLRGGIDIAGAVRDTLARRRYSDSGTIELHTEVLALIARRPDLPGELALAGIASEHVDVHRAALRTLRARGVPVPETTLYDPYLIATLTRDQLHAGLADDRALYRSNIALWLGDHPDESSRPPLADFIRRITAGGEFPDDGPRHYELRWAVRALLAIGGADAVLDELLRSSDRNVAEPVLRYPEKLGPGVARGMVHVFETDEHWKHEVARRWLARHAADPAIVAALAEHDLTPADLKRQKADD